MSWSSIIGQERVKEILIGSLEKNRLGHAYLFSGPDGTGKLATAIELAKTTNCEKLKTAACGECQSCKKFNTLQHPNLHLIFNLPVGKNETSSDSPITRLSQEEIRGIQEQLSILSGNHYYKMKIPRANAIKINSVREIRREATMTMFGGGKKVFIVIDAEKMNDAAANALLKTLEEPHPDTLIILITSMHDSLLPTIISRCQHVRFESFSEAVIAESLIKFKNIAEKEAKEIAHLSNGSYSKGLLLIDNEYQAKQEQTLELVRTFLLAPRVKIVEEAERLGKEFDRVELESTITIMQQWFRNVMLKKEDIQNDLSLSENTPENKFLNNYPNWNYIQTMDVLERSILLLNKNVYIPLIIIDLTINLRSAVKTGIID